MTDSAVIASTLEALGWCVTIPHTIDQLISVRRRRYRTRPTQETTAP